MPVVKLESKQFKAISLPSLITDFPANSKRVSPQLDSPVNMRVSLYIENTGLNPGLVRFGESIQGDGSDINLGAGDQLEFTQRDTCPREAINLGSVLGTTWALVEGVEKVSG